MKIQNSFFFLALLAVFMTTAMAANPTDIIAPVQQQIDQAQGDLQQKVVQHIVEGNLTPEHLQKDVNATKEELTKKAAEIQQNASITQQQLQQKAKEEVKNQVNQVNQKVQQPGFEATLAVIGILATAYSLRRRD
jgi:PGF-CTERM protein